MIAARGLAVIGQQEKNCIVYSLFCILFMLLLILSLLSY